MKKNFLFLNRTSSKKILSFLLVGGITAVWYFSIYGLLYNYFNINNFIAVSVAYFSAVSFHFFANRCVTFKAQDMRIAHQLKSYSILLGVNYSNTVFCTQGALAIKISPYFGMIVAIPINIVIAYTVCNFWVFKKRILANK